MGLAPIRQRNEFSPPMKLSLPLLIAACFATGSRATPVKVSPVTATHGMVVAGHPQAAAAGATILKAGGNAIDAAVAVSLALGVAEPYGSGLGGKLMLLYYEAKSGKVFVIDAMDACGSAIAVETYRKLPEEAHSYGYSSVCVPGLAAGLWAAHQKWGEKKWADDLAPAIKLARDGFEVLPKTRDLFEEQISRLRGGDAEIARIYLPGGKLPVDGMRLKNPDLARTMEIIAASGRDGFYRGEIAEKIIAGSRRGGGVLAPDDLVHYEARIIEPVAMDFRGYHLVSAPPPSIGPAIFLPTMKVLETETFGGGPLRTAANLDLIGRVWHVVDAEAHREIADSPTARADFEKLISPESIRAIRIKALAADAGRKTAQLDETEPAALTGSTTHFVVVDAKGNIVSATQSLSLHFGACVVPPGTGVVLNDTMTDFSFIDLRSPNLVAPGRRPRSTVSPTIVFREGRPIFAIGVPGAARIPTAMLQVLLDRLVLDRPLAEAIGDTRVHYVASTTKNPGLNFEAEKSFPEGEAKALRSRGWSVDLDEEPGRGRHFGGVNAIEFNANGTLTGYADPRRTNAAVGY
jgi:gamma-glutamyltranspeptidase/glutathione hydrolase